MNERKILGVCDWLAEEFRHNVEGVRILFVAAAIFIFGSPVISYFILYLVNPSEY
ncbi:MAG: PspC domain-containing protein [Bacteroidota bacterium]|nr:PspC domain-containing protein [Bacteroidota bacterium]